jgi:hypothetical protein
MADDEPKRSKPRPEESPPGYFVTDDLRAQTARFIDELKQRLGRPEPEDTPKLGPPSKRH